MANDPATPATPATMAGDVQNRRTRLIQASIVFGVIALVGVLFIAKFTGSDDKPTQIQIKNPLTISRVDNVDPEQVWISNGEERLGASEARLEKLEEFMTDAAARNERLTTENDDLQARLETIEQGVNATINEPAAIDDGAASDFGNSFGAVDPFAAVTPSSTGPTVPEPLQGNAPLALQSTLIRFTLSESSEPSGANQSGAIGNNRLRNEAIKDPKYYLPAGAHATAVVVAGAAAPVSVTGQADPRPVLIRITGPARSAAKGRGSRLKSDIGGCVITGEARGDISSERVYVRLQTMTCRRDDGVIETQVQGFVTGTGQAGVRGDVITREGNLVQKSAAAGILSGFGASVSQGLTPSGSVIKNGASGRDDGDLLDGAFKAGIGKGIGNAGDRLAQYYIKRAEQYQPVVSLKGGTPVEVIFITGTWLDGRPRNSETGDE